MDTSEIVPGIPRTVSGMPQRKRCHNCGKLFPKTKPNRTFCSDYCRKDFHKNGGAHMKVLQDVRKDIPGLIREALKKPPAEWIEAVIAQLQKRAGSIVYGTRNPSQP